MDKWQMIREEFELIVLCFSDIGLNEINARAIAIKHGIDSREAGRVRSIWRDVHKNSIA